MPKYRIVELAPDGVQRVTNYADLERHHPARGNERGRIYGTVNGEREELLGRGGKTIQSGDGDYYVSKDFVLQTSANLRHPMVPAVANGYVDGIDARNGVLQIWDKPAGAPDREMIAQYRHMDLTRTGLKNGDTVSYGQPLAPQSGYGGGKSNAYGPHVHLDMNASYLPTLDRYLKDVHNGRITTDSYPRNQVNVSTPAMVEDVSAKGSIGAGSGSRAPMADGMLVHGESGEEVRRLQVALAGLGYTGKDGKPLVPDRDFGDNTRHAVQAFQRDHKLDDDGKAGFHTLRAINTEVANRSRGVAPVGPVAEPRPQTQSQAVLTNGAKGDAVIRLQQQLGALGYTGIDGKPLLADGDFGGHTRHAVDAFQKAHGLDADGKVGKDTLVELDKARDRPLISEATHAGHGLYAAIGKQLPAGTQPATVANVTLQAMESGITKPSELRAVSMQGSDALVIGNTPGFHTRVDLQAPTPGLQAMSDHLTCQATLAQQAQREPAQQSNRQPDPVMQ